MKLKSGFIYSVLIILMFVSCKQYSDLNVMTFNIRYSTEADGENAWQYRKENASDMIRKANVDILGMQEVLVDQMNDLKKTLPEYESVGVGRMDGKEQGEFSPIFYKTDKFEKIDYGYFWLSENPSDIGKKGWDAACERIATWLILKEKKSGKEIFIICTHFDHEGQIARKESSLLLVNKIKELSHDLPVLALGDFNADPESNVVQLITKSDLFSLTDSKSIAKEVYGENSTYHNYGKIPVEGRKTIDYIFLSSSISVKRYEVLPEKNETGYFSDHSPVLVNIKF